MVAPRQDAWTEDDDLLLAEVTLRHIREGGTQLQAFEEVGEKLNRTAAACGFRWNSLVRKKYEAAIQIAKAQRQKRNYNKVARNTTYQEEFASELQSSKTEHSEESISYEAIIRFLKEQKDSFKRVKASEKELIEKSREIEQLRDENKKLKERVNHLESEHRIVNDDYKALIQIMDRARRLAFLEGEEEPSNKPVFKMDLNGNLERINK